MYIAAEAVQGRNSSTVQSFRCYIIYQFERACNMQKLLPQQFFFFTFLLDNLVGICSKNIRSYMQNCTWDMFVYANAGDATAVSQEKAAGTFQFQSEYSSNLNQMTVEASVSFCLFVFCCCVELPCQVFYYWLWK